MRSKLCWIPFIPLTLASVTLKALQIFSVIPLSENTVSYYSIFAALIMFALCIVFVAIDKETSEAYLLSRNIPAAVFSMFAAALVASKTSLNTILSLQSNALDPFKLISAIFGMLTSVCLVVIALAHIQGRNFLPRMGVLFLSMPVWGGLMLIGEFLENRTVSVNTINPIMLFAYAFAMIFMFKLSMVIATVDGRNPVKAIYLYGMPLACIGFTLGVGGICSIIVNGLDYSENILQFAFLALALYAVSLCMEINKNARKKKEQIVKFDLDEFETEQSTYGDYGLNKDNFVAASEEKTGDYDYDYSYASVESETFVKPAESDETESYDYIYGYGYEYGQDSEDDDLVVAPDVEEEDDVILVDSDVVETFEEGVVSSNEDKRGASDYDDEALKKIEKLIEDIKN